MMVATGKGDYIYHSAVYLLGLPFIRLTPLDEEQLSERIKPTVEATTPPD